MTKRALGKKKEIELKAFTSSNIPFALTIRPA